MINKGDTTRPQSVKAKFDQDFHASPHAGGVLVERALRRLGLYKILKGTFPRRSQSCGYQAEDWAYAHIASMLLGGRGISAIELIRKNKTTCRIFGLKKGAPSPPTIYRGLCRLAGLSERKFEKHYCERGATQVRLDLGGKERPAPRMRRLVPEEPEWASDKNQEVFHQFTESVAKRCIKALKRSIMRLHGWTVLFGDGTDLEVQGDCFDAARKGRKGDKILRLMLLMLGPIAVGQDVLPGNTDEGNWIPRMIERTRKAVRSVTGRRGRVLALMDAAYFEKLVIEELEKNGWDFIIGANQHRDKLKKLALSQPENLWSESGADCSRGWRRSQVCVFTHTPGGWGKPVTIVCRRWEKEEEMEGIWHYSFVATGIEKGRMPSNLLKRHGYAQSIWMLYSTKQGRENHLKTPLRDLRLHNPPSCRLGVNQAFYTLALAASNIAMVLRYRVMPEETRGMHLWKIRESFLTIAGYIANHAKTLTVYLCGGDIPLWMQNVWERAYAEAGRL